MSYNVGVYSAPTGAETAFAGQTIASATWNAINTDYATAFGQIGTPLLTTIPVVVSFSNVNTDTSVPVPTLPGFTKYVLQNLTICNPSIVPPSGSVALYTAAAAGGTNLISASTTITITSTVSGTNNNAQVINSSIGSTIVLNNSILFIRVTASGSFTGTSTMQIRWVA